MFVIQLTKVIDNNYQKEVVSMNTTQQSTNSVAGKNTLRSRTSGTRKRKPKKNQIPFGLLVLALTISLLLYLNTYSGKLVLYTMTGFCFGFILQKSRFCFTASFRDPYLTGSVSITKAVLIACAFTTIAFAAIMYGHLIRGLDVPTMSSVKPISLATAFGGTVFGIGMVIAGGCASGTLMRIGEGFSMQILSLVFFIIGSLVGVNHYGFWKHNFMDKGIKIFLPDYFGWLGGLLINLLIIFAIYIFADKWGKRKTAN